MSLRSQAKIITNRIEALQARNRILEDALKSLLAACEGGLSDDDENILKARYALKDGE